MRAFYCIYQEDLNIDANNLIDLNRNQINKLIEKIILRQGNFIGFIDDENTTIQFVFEGKNTVLIDIPLLDKCGSFSKTISVQQIKKIITELKAPYKLYIDYLKMEFSFFTKK